MNLDKVNRSELKRLMDKHVLEDDNRLARPEGGESRVELWDWSTDFQKELKHRAQEEVLHLVFAHGRILTWLAMQSTDQSINRFEAVALTEQDNLRI